VRMVAWFGVLGHGEGPAEEECGPPDCGHAIVRRGWRWLDQYLRWQSVCGLMYDGTDPVSRARPRAGFGGAAGSPERPGRLGDADRLSPDARKTRKQPPKTAPNAMTSMGICGT